MWIRPEGKRDREKESRLLGRCTLRSFMTQFMDLLQSRFTMSGDILICYHYLNFLLLVMTVMLITLLQTDIVPPRMASRRSNIDLKQYDLPLLDNISSVAEWNEHGISMETYNTKAGVYVRHDDGYHARLSVNDRKVYGGFQSIDSHRGIYVYSATYISNSVNRSVKVIVIVPGNTQMCQLFCDFGVQQGNVLRQTGECQYIPEPNWNYTYRAAIVTCHVHLFGFKPKTVSIVSASTGYNLKNNLTVRYPSGRKNNLTRCYPSLHDKFNDTATLVWSIEISRLQGVDRFVFYNFEMDAKVSKVLLQYQKEGLVQVKNWYLPINYSEIHYWGQLAAIHDCHFSQLGNARFVLFADLDELVVPRKVHSLVELAESMLFETIFRNKYHGALIFRNVFFPLMLPVTKSVFRGKKVARKLRIDPLLHTIHARVQRAYDRSKVLVIPEAVELLWIHGVEKFRSDWIPRVVEMDVALLHHYRFVPSPDMMAPWEQDEILVSDSLSIVRAVKGRYSILRQSGIL